ncbi:MAG TPA: putative metal-binding motif-containing protein, partial [Pyrinomonadaceae bacterium]
EKKCDISAGLVGSVKQFLAEGRLQDTIRHELAHTFDTYHNFIYYYSDSSHAWVDFWMEYGEYLTRSSPYSFAPDLVLQTKVIDFTRRYDALATSDTWARCIKPGSVCEGERIFTNKVFAGLLLRYERLHGRAALSRAFDFYRQYGLTHSLAAAAFDTPEFKTDLLAEALSYGIGADASPELDAWFWPVSASAREKLRQTYPQPNPFVQDADGDGWTPARGDFDDRDPAVHPGAAEAANGKDDDCNGYVDDILRPAGTTLFSPPARLAGSLQAGQTAAYRFEASGTFLMRARTTSGEWGGLVSVAREGESVPVMRTGIVPTSSTVAISRLEGAGPWALTVTATSGSGDYEVVLVPAPQGGEGTGNVFALPLRAPGSSREHTLVPGGLARAIGTLPGATIAAADAQPDSQGRWPTNLSGVEVLVAGQPTIVLAVISTGGDGYAVDFVTPTQPTSAAVSGHIEVVIRHTPSGARWRLDDADLLDASPMLWGRQSDGQSAPVALALESPTLVAFDESNRVPAGGETRVMLLSSGLGVGRTAANTRLVALLADGSRLSLPVEQVGATSLPGIHQIVFKAGGAAAQRGREVPRARRVGRRAGTGRARERAILRGSARDGRAALFGAGRSRGRRGGEAAEVGLHRVLDDVEV